MHSTFLAKIETKIIKSLNSPQFPPGLEKFAHDGI